MRTTQEPEGFAGIELICDRGGMNPVLLWVAVETIMS